MNVTREETPAQAQPIKLPAPAAMLEMIQGFWVSRAICVVAELGLPDLLKKGPMKAEDLARSVGAPAPSIYRVLRALASVGVFSEDDRKRFTLTPLGDTLRSDVAGSLRLLAVEVLGRNHYPAWGQLQYSVKTGAIAFDHVFGMSKWQYNAENPKEATAFDNAMATFNSMIPGAVVASYDFSTCGTIVDVGGGNGSLLAAILKAHPNLRGVVADLPHVLDGAQARLTGEGVSECCEIVACDFFKSVPKGDCYLLKWIIHDWDDQSAETILKNCRTALKPGGRVLLVESIVEPRNGTSLARFMDLAMRVMTGGRERTKLEYQALLGGAGLRITNVISTGTELSVT
jgi:hypothetical protein